MIQIGFGTNQQLHSRLIRWATDSPWSHVWIEYWSHIWGGPWAAHAGPTGVVKVPLEQVWTKYPERIRFDCISLGGDGFAWARNYIGAPYDYGAIWNGLLFAIHRSTKWEWLRHIALRNTAKFTCSEFVTGFLQASGIPDVVGLEPELTTPGELYRIIESSRGFSPKV